MSTPVSDLARILVVEDEPAIRESIVEVLSSAYHVTSASTGRDAIDSALRRPFDAIVLDRRLPDSDGIEVVRALRRARLTTPILMLTALGTVDDRVSGLDSGANDYLVKPFDFAELLARIRALLRGYAAAGERRAIGDWTFTPDNQTVYSPTGERILLSAGEAAVLVLLSNSPEHVFTREEILSAAFHEDDTAGTVDTYVHYVRRKTAREMIETVRSQGYRIGTPE